MLVAVMCEDKAGSIDLRRASREAHLAYLDETGVVAQAGPLLDSSGEMCGSLLMLEVDSVQAAEVWAAQDPYAQAGLFGRTTIRAWNRVIG